MHLNQLDVLYHRLHRSHAMTPSCTMSMMASTRALTTFTLITTFQRSMYWNQDVKTTSIHLPCLAPHVTLLMSCANMNHYQSWMLAIGSTLQTMEVTQSLVRPLASTVLQQASIIMYGGTEENCKYQTDTCLLFTTTAVSFDFDLISV